MLEHLFGSKTRVKLLTLFLKDTDQSFFVRELTRKLKLQINAIRRELENLEKIGIIKIIKKPAGKTASGLDKKYYQVNKDFVLYSELKALFVKSQLFIRQSLLDKLTKLGKIDFLALTGIFVGQKSPFKTDMLIVGRINRKKLADLLKIFEIEFGYEINYTVMTSEEFQYRKEITDKFLYEILESKKIIVVDKIP
jgi:hypothetical protein